MSVTNTTAPTPTDRVGEDVGRLERVRHLKRGTEYEVLGEAEAQVATGTVRTTMLGKPLGNIYRRIADGSSLTVYRDPTTGKLWCRPTDEFRDGRFETIASASAPSDPAGAGGDLGELERLSAKAAPGLWRNGPRCIFAKSTNPVIGGDDVVVSTAYSDRSLTDDDNNCAYIVALVNAHRSGQLVASTPGQKGAGEAIKFAVGIDDHYDRLEFLQSWLSGDTSEWPEFIQTPPSPPSATPEGDPPMTVEEAKQLLEGIRDPVRLAENFRRVDQYADADRIELALRTLHAAGEVRHG